MPHNITLYIDVVQRDTELKEKFNLEVNDNLYLGIINAWKKECIIFFCIFAKIIY